MGSYIITGQDLTPLKLYDCIKRGHKIEIDDYVMKRLEHSRKFLESKIQKGELIYGVNTNVGALLKEKRKEKNEIELIREHALSKEMFEENDIARATLLVLLNQLALGYSTISPNTYNFLLNFFNSGEKLLFSKIGSLGASGDLIPLAN